MAEDFSAVCLEVSRTVQTETDKSEIQRRGSIMRRTKLAVLLLSLMLIMTMMLAACGSSGSSSGSEEGTVTEETTEETNTLESYLKTNEEMKKSIENAAADTDGMEIKVEGNSIIYSYKIEAVEGYDESADMEEVKKSLDEGLAEDKAASTFGNICKSVEDATEISGISVVVEYLAGGEVISTRTFTSADIPPEEN